MESQRVSGERALPALPLLGVLPLPTSSHPARSISSLSSHRSQAQGLKAGFGICTTMSEGPRQISLTSLQAGDQSRGHGHPPEQSLPALPQQSDHAIIPLLKRELSSPFFLLFQPPASFLQLGERVGGRVGWHGRILNERVRRLDDVSELGTDPRVHGHGSLDGQGPHHVMGQLLLST